MSSTSTLGEQVLRLIIDSIGKNPASKAEAVALVAYILEHDVLPLVEQLKDWAIKELNEAEQHLAKKGMEGIRVVEAFVAQQVEEVVSGNCCRPKIKPKMLADAPKPIQSAEKVDLKSQ